MRFNFLPWREAEHRRKKNAFNRLLMLHGLLGVVIVFLVWIVTETKLQTQADRRDMLRSQISVLDDQIREIANLRRDIDALQARQHSVEILQADRYQPVLLLQQLSQQIPEGVMLKSLRQGNSIMLSGYALSNGRVSELLRNLDPQNMRTSTAQPELIEIKSGGFGEGREARKLFEFTLTLPVIATRVNR